MPPPGRAPRRVTGFEVRRPAPGVLIAATARVRQASITMRFSSTVRVHVSDESKLGDHMIDQPRPAGAFRRAALFVDFENVHIGLSNSSPEAGHRFATQPDRWVQWMEQALGPLLVDLDDQPRTLLRRICYLEPGRSSRFRSYFTRAGFRVVDCPSLTAAGKNSADIHMVLDILDTLSHPTWFDEFIVLSADADFTPVLLRLREHDRRTAMLVSGPAAAPLRAACDFAIPDSMFIDEALGLGVDEPTFPAVSTVDEHAALRERMQVVVRKLVADAALPVTMAKAAHEVRSVLGPDVAATSWAGYATFGAFVADAVDAHLQINTSRPPGWLYDPARHDLDQVAPSILPAGAPEVAERVSRVVDAPLLAPETYRTLFDAIVIDGRPMAGGQADAERATRDACAARGHTVPRAAVHFVLLGLQYSKVDWRSAEHDAGSLARAFADNVLRLAANAQMDLSEDEQHQIRGWIADQY